MTWEQEMRIQVKEKSEQLAKIIAKEMVEDRVNAMRADIEKEAKEMAKDLANEMVEDRVNAMRADIEKEAKEVAKETAKETAKKLLAEKIAPEVVAKCTGLSLEQVKKLANG